MVAPQRQHATGAALATRGVNISIPHHLRLEKYRQPIHSMVRIICAPEKRREECTSATTNYTAITEKNDFVAPYLLGGGHIK